MTRIIAGMIALFLITTATGQDEHSGQSIDIYRTESGQVSNTVLEGLEILETRARQYGYVTLWLTANVLYEPDLNLISDGEAAKQDREVRKVLDKVLKPLIREGSVWVASERPGVEGPGQLVHATAEGVAALVHESEIIHIHSTVY